VKTSNKNRGFNQQVNIRLLADFRSLVNNSGCKNWFDFPRRRQVFCLAIEKKPVRLCFAEAFWLSAEPNPPAMGKIYFISDSHLGVPDRESSLKREKLLVRWLEEVAPDAGEIFLLGDIFDFWFEYRTVVPKGFVRLLGKLAELSDRGIKLHFFTGNHDLWAFDYLEREIGLEIHRQPIERMVDGKRLYIGHGDGLGPGDRGYKLLKAIFSCRLCQRLFSFIHPGTGTRLAMFLSRRSRVANGKTDEHYLGDDRESLVGYCREVLKDRSVDYFVFGHRHLPLDMEVAPGCRYINTGDWVTHFSYALFENGKLELKYFS
jgi:UDP-2,3-diacylglucosamine hydrolase